MSASKRTKRRAWKPVFRNDGCVEIPLTRGKRAIIDRADLTLAQSGVWHAHQVTRKGRVNWYAVARFGRKLVRLHRLLLNAPEHMDIDHANGNGLDNRRSNLRLCTKTQNRANQHTISGKSRFRGVWFNIVRKKWCAMIAKTGRRYNLGYFDTEEEAARAYDRKAIELYGEFAAPNFPISA